jgi:hypothetical protein
MKKALQISAAVLAAGFLLVLLLPWLFKDQIKAKLDEEMNSRIKGEVFLGDFNVTLLSNFPNLTLQLDKFGIVGKGVFAGDTLANIERFNVVVDLMSVVSGDQIRIKKFMLDKPQLDLKILPDGTANWDIYVADTSSTDTSTEDTSASSFSLVLNEYGVTDANVKFEDQQSGMKMELHKLFHNGAGNFSDDLFVLRTRTVAERIYFKYDGITYAKNLSLNARIDMDMDMQKQLYTFKDNRIVLNDLHLGFEGFVQPDGELIRMDVKFKALENEFKNFLSLVPGVYTKDFENIQTEGKLAFNGFATGTLDEKRIPSFGLEVKVSDASVKYPDLPSSIKAIALDLMVKNKSGNLEDTEILLNRFHAELGSNPIDMHAHVIGLTTSQVDATVDARLNLGELATLIPMEGTQMKGLFELKGKAKGIYSEKSMPVVSALFSLKDGYLKSDSFPAPVEALSLSGSLESDGSLPNSTLQVENFHAVLEGESIDASLKVIEFQDPLFNMAVNGNVDLGKWMKIFPIENTTLTGKLQLTLKTQGRQSDVEAGRYQKVPTSGTLSVSNLAYKSIDLPQGFTLKEGLFSFDPQAIRIQKYSGSVGSSEIQLNGVFTNYLAYALAENGNLGGQLTLVSPKFNVNEWLVEEPTGATTEVEEPLSPYEVPDNIRFDFTATIGEVLYDNLTLSNLRGGISLKDKKVSMQDVKFGLLDGFISMTGDYAALDITQPTVNFNMQIMGMSVKRAYETFNTVKLLAPAAGYVEGKFNSNLSINSQLGMDMMPKMETLTGLGDIQIQEGKASNLPILDKIGEAAKFVKIKEVTLKDTKIKFAIRDGRMYVDPFTVTTGNTILNISGSQGLDQSLDYQVDIDAPSGKAGNAVNEATAQITQGNALLGSRVKATVFVGGTFLQPQIKKVSGVSSEGGMADQAQNLVEDKLNDSKNKAKEEADKLKKEAEDKARQEADRLKREAEDRVRNEADRLKKEAENKTRQEADKIKKEAEEKTKKAKEEAERKAKEEADKKLKEEANKLKNKIKFPK